jgi:FkbM family methyltransferase
MPVIQLDYSKGAPDLDAASSLQLTGSTRTNSLTAAANRNNVMSLPGMLRNALLFHTVPKRASVLLIGRGELFVDTKDNRGRAILDCAGMTQPFTTVLWRSLIKNINPELVLDIGANYGEIALSSTYSSGTQIHLFEPNPYVRAWLKKSVLSRKDVNDVHLHPQLVGNSIGQQTFVIDLKWSGTSSAVGEISGSDRMKGQGAEHFEEITVPCTTIDECLANSGVTPGQRLLFKIDVEGYEGHVVSGMKNTLLDAAAYAGIIEFDRNYLRRAGTDPDELVRYFAENGVLRGVFGNRISERISQLPDHFDLLVASSPSILAQAAHLGVVKYLFRAKS